MKKKKTKRENKELMVVIVILEGRFMSGLRAKKNATWLIAFFFLNFSYPFAILTLAWPIATRGSGKGKYSHRIGVLTSQFVGTQNQTDGKLS